ncbi:HipA domain-containing protein [Rhodobaculum claviforme]|uniref:Serine/threonine-protein kinase HipA n=1 Tax=Rhodobaculum claviforme TaxID=1549854 RepID=A0A934TMX8_9RHOB|nr:HipA domain-containing protein [Rhodobaculum claviforme]MBK5928451.1 hypothetical protein [Rhodobaculum claviforme]
MILDVWLEGFEAPIGVLERHDDKSLTFSYGPQAFADPDRGRISMSLPVRDAPYTDDACIAYFGNLLFEGQELERVRARHGIDRDDHGGLLYHLGADCPGAISVTPQGAGPGKRPGVFPQDYEEIGQPQLARIVASLHHTGRLPDGARDPSPVAGVQPKLALLHHDGAFHLPKPGSGAPTTHILKVAPREDAVLTRHEAALLDLARHLDLDVAQTTRLQFPQAQPGQRIEALLSTRFDRILDGDLVHRVHVEDFCQALGLPRQLKYERDGVEADRRFSAAAVGRMAGETAQPAQFRISFLKQSLFNLAVGNTDNHGKNSSILYTLPRGVLAPLYDVVPVVMDRRVTHEFAFRVGGHDYIEDVDQAAMLALMGDLGFSRPRLSERWLKLLRGIAVEGIDRLHRDGGKALADYVAAQLGILEAALKVDVGIPQRDFFPRAVRGRSDSAGGWGAFS